MRFCVLLFVVMTVAFAPAPFPRAERRGGRPVNEMVGTWKGTYEITITADRLNYSTGFEYELRLDTSVRPRAYDIRGVGQANDGWEFLGIYKVEGDTLTLCYNGRGRLVRPTAFDGPGKGDITEVYKRVR